MEKTYRFAHAETAIELLRPLAVDYVAQGQYTMQDFAILEWNDPRPQPELEEIQILVGALRAAEDLAVPVYTEEQLAAVGASEEAEEPLDVGLGGV
jgi:hypothetical protein